MQSDERCWPQTDRVWRHFEQMDAVMRRLDVDVIAAARTGRGTALAQARNVCLSCQSYRRCRRWLDGTIAPAAPAAFCPNAAFFAAHCRSTPRPEADA